MSDFTQGIKQLAKQAVEESQPCDVCFGTVVSVSPLAVEIEQKQPLTAAFLILTDAVKDFTLEFDVMGEHIKATVPNGLKPGDKVVLMQKKGGQKYVVAGRYSGGGL